MADTATDSTSAGSVISLPSGGGAISGLGETFSPDLFTGTGNLTVPIALPPGRHDVAPRLTLAYSSGHGNGPFGLGWTVGLPGVTRKTSRGVPRYLDAGDEADTFLLSGAEDLVPQPATEPDRTPYRPRTEGLFARIDRVRSASGDVWEVQGRDGVRTRYGTLRPTDADPGWRDPAAVAAPNGAVFAWRITETADLLGNRVRYSYLRDHGDQPGHRWDQPLISRIEYADYGDPLDPSFLVSVTFDYETRPDPFSDRRAGFEIRTSLRCRTIRMTTHAADGIDRVVREYRLAYEQAAFTGVSLLSRVDVVGIDAPAEEHLPPITFGYSGFDPAERRFRAVTGAGLPTLPLSDPDITLVDLHGSGLPDIVQLDDTPRWWTNRGDGRFDLPRPFTDAPPHALGDPGVHLLDADGDGRADLVVAAGPQAGYFSSTFTGEWSRRSFRRYAGLPSVGLDGSGVRLVDLDGDGLTDVLASGTRASCWFNDRDPQRAWQRTTPADGLPDLDLADPRVRLADMTGDGLTDIVVLRNGDISYRPNLGHGRFGPPVAMRSAPRLPDGHDPRRLLLGDIDGDGATDLVYVERGRVLLWGNRNGNAWTVEPVTIPGTPDVVDVDSVQLANLYGTGMAGILWSRAATGSDGSPLRFLDVTGGTKPHLLVTIDGHLGATTTITYRPSTADFLADQAEPATRWRTTLPFPVQVVARVEMHDLISTGTLVTEYRYRHGYWDGVEREFRGFAMVEQRDSETFHATGAHHSPPTLSRTWFHPGPVAATESGDWTELDLTHEYWPGDPPLLTRPPEMVDALARLPRADRRDAIRALRGQVLRTELYALDGTDRADRPYTVTESLGGVRAEAPRVWFPFDIAERTTHWERGSDPMTQFSFAAGHDTFGFPTRQLAVAVPRGRDPRVADPGAREPYLATVVDTGYARRPDLHLVDRVAHTTTSEVVNDGRAGVAQLRDAVLAGSAELRVIAHTRTFYDGPAYEGLPLGALGERGLPVRTESLAVTDAFLDELFPPGSRPPYLDPAQTAVWPSDYPAEFRDLVPPLAGHVHHPDAEVPGHPAGWYVVRGRTRYDVHDQDRVPRGLPLGVRDALGAESGIEYDEHDLLPVRTVDPAGLVVTAVQDPRVLRPVEVTDENGTTSRITFSPAGLVTEQFVRGENGEGDATAPSVTLRYDLQAFAERGQPASVRTERRVHHDTRTDVPPEERDAILVSLEYSDGFGRVLQRRSQAEDVLFAGSDPAVPGRTGPDNVIVSGWQTYDNKGRVVERYEPFFAAGFDFVPPVDAELGRKATIDYDPRGAAVRTVNPDGSEQLVVLGVPVDLAHPDLFAPTPWERFSYDANDNAGRTHPAAAAAYQNHWDTPASRVVDALGRTVVAVSLNGSEQLVTRSSYDIQGNLVAVTDALGRTAFAYRYDLIGRRWRADGIDAGRHDIVPDALGHPVETRDAKGALTLAAFDGLHRPIRVWARDSADGPVTLRQRIEYGDAGDRDQARAHNLLGRAVSHHDEAGVTIVDDVDFAGRVLDSARRPLATAAIIATYELAATQGWVVAPFVVDWSLPESDLLDATEYRTTTEFDALGRVTRQMLPTDVEGRRRELVPRYNRAGGLEQVVLDGVVHVQRIAYDALGRRTLIAYGNGVLTRCTYDPDTFRLTRMRTEHYTLDGLVYRPSGPVLQDYGYAYDLAGNPLTLRDRTPGCGVPNTPEGPDALDRRFGYDPVYRLVTATGREADHPVPDPPWLDTPRGTDPTLTRGYTETYVYDALGGLQRLAHVNGSGGFTRDHTVDGGSNRLVRTTVGGTPFDYAYDAVGNLTAETTSRHFAWNHADQLVAFGTQTPGVEPSLHAQYRYDAAGQRTTKLVRRQGGAVEVTHYVAGIEHHRWAGGENTRLDVMDERSRIAVVRVGPAAPGDTGPAIQFHLGDHQGSNAVVIDETGTITNREEYTPYGETSFGSFARKRYRFTGKERDEESGLADHGARFYAPHLGRWISSDPKGHEGGLNSYQYCAGDPCGKVDRNGRDWCWNPLAGDCGVDWELVGKVAATAEVVFGCGAVVASSGLSVAVCLDGVDNFTAAWTGNPTAKQLVVSGGMRLAGASDETAETVGNWVATGFSAALSGAALARRPPAVIPPPPAAPTGRQAAATTAAEAKAGTAVAEAVGTGRTVSRELITGNNVMELDNSAFRSLANPADLGHAEISAFVANNKNATLVIGRPTFREASAAHGYKPPKALLERLQVRADLSFKIEDLEPTAAALRAAVEGAGRVLSVSDSLQIASAIRSRRTFVTRDFDQFLRARELGVKRVEFVGSAKKMAAARNYNPVTLDW